MRVDFSHCSRRKVWPTYQLLLSALMAKRFIRVVVFIARELYELLISAFHISAFNPRRHTQLELTFCI